MAKKKPKRRGQGEGSVYQRADGRWCATINVGYTSLGKRRRRTIFGTSREGVLDELARVRLTLLEGTFVEPSKLRMEDFLDRWLEDASRPTIRETTYVSYKGILENHIKPRIGGIFVAKLTPIHVQALYGDMERNGASPRLRQLTHAVLRRAMKQALKWELVYRNVCDAVDPPRVARREVKALSAGQVGKLLEAAKGERLEAIFAVAIGTGMRLGEIFGLRWENVDLEKATVHVRHTLIELKGKLTLAEPKTSKSRRRIDLPAKVVTALKDHRKRMAAEGFGDVPWVFCSTTGGPLRRNHFHDNVWKPILAGSNLPPVRFHDLRHTSASLLLTAGVHPKVVQERLGHAQISITLDTYSHVLPTLGIEAAGKLDEVLPSDNGGKVALPKKRRPVATGQ